MRKRYLRRSTSKNGLYQVHGDRVAEEPVAVEDVEHQLTVLIPRLVGQHEVDVVVEVAEVLRPATGQLQVHAVVDRLVATVQGAVDVHHPGVALVHVLRGEAEHVVVEPMGAHGLVPVARNIEKAAGIGRPRGAWIRGAGVDGVAPGQDDGVVVVVELIGKEESACKAVVLRSVMSVVFVGRNRVNAETSVLVSVKRKLVVMAEDDGLAVAGDDQLRRNRPVERPHAVHGLGRQARVELQRDGSRRIDAGIQGRRDARVVGGIGLGAFLRHLDVDLWRKLLEPLMGPDRPRRPPLDGAGVAEAHPFQRGVQELLRGVGLASRGRIEERRRMPRQDVEPQQWLGERLHAEEGAARKARRDRRVGLAGDVRVQAVLPGQRAPGRQQSPAEQVTSRDLSDRARPDNLHAVSTGVLGFPLARFRCLGGQIHTQTSPDIRDR
jgi:hypothetical protein